jgi:hypothetical protein
MSESSLARFGRLKMPNVGLLQRTAAHGAHEILVCSTSAGFDVNQSAIEQTVHFSGHRVEATRPDTFTWLGPMKESVHGDPNNKSYPICAGGSRRYGLSVHHR